ncbi:hypothetical protein P5G50_02250 [Leifsonia sp. F6_8S_P_1B]|uniref:Uncharacterized protein n=1 Tax=Leifsonia williamsii TaxID=3035919 RepID=A0ABT8K9V1_9MICO|nr:hypothetical protein [Leifsonia williamsii]MDN4613262.1 hypothetical protein [Leifsonia williamsii]
MTNENDSERPARNAGRVWYSSALALLAGGSVFAFAILPVQMGGLVSAAAALVAIAIDRAVRNKVDTRPRGLAAVAYLAVGALVLVISLALVLTVARGSSVWFGVVLAVIVAMVFFVAIWVPSGPRIRQTTGGRGGR